MLRCIQVALNTADMAGSLRLYSEVFGFRNAGGQGIWGSIARVQGLKPDDRAIMWWMIGGQEFMQLEFFTHMQPKQRPLPAGWRSCDHGWVRFGIAVDGLDSCLAALAAFNIASITPVMGQPRRFAFRDPYAGIIVEVRERASDAAATGPDVLYVTSSVSDLEAARVYYRDVVGLSEIGSLDLLHSVADEALWGLAGARREGFVVRAGEILLEIVQYHAPSGRPKPVDHSIGDQGIMNIALGARATAPVAAALERLGRAGYVPPSVFSAGGILCAYIIDPERELEFAAIPEELDSLLGFAPAPGFLGAAPAY